MSIKHIAYCTDFSENAEVAFQEALAMANTFKAKLTIIHVLPPVVNPMLTETEWLLPEEPKNTLLAKLQERMVQDYGSRIDKAIDHELVVLDGHVSTEIIKYLENSTVDLIVMGSYGFTGMGLVVFGSVAKRVSHKAPCSVMIVRKRPDV